MKNIHSCELAIIFSVIVSAKLASREYTYILKGNNKKVSYVIL